jgi:hypothetical protein
VLVSWAEMVPTTPFGLSLLSFLFFSLSRLGSMYRVMLGSQQWDGREVQCSLLFFENPRESAVMDI